VFIGSIFHMMKQILAWRLSQHHLLQQADPAQMLQVVSRICGAQAQVMSAAELTISARVRDITPSDVQNALWKDRTLVKTWLLRGTLHLIPANDFPLYIAALSTLKHFKRASWQKYHGVTLDELDAITEGVRVTLSDRGMTREALADAIAEHTGLPKLRDLLRSGWGAILKPIAFQGLLCFGESEGQNVTFVQPEQWIGAWESLEPEQALEEIARRYLNAYGPSTADDFARWFGLEPAPAKKVFRALKDELEEVTFDGFKGVMLSAALPEIQRMNAPKVVRLLPYFDPFTIAMSRQSSYLMEDAHKARVYRNQGWISPVVLVDGRFEGVWEHDKKRDQVTITVEMFTPPDARVKDEIEAEAQRVAAFLGGTLQLAFKAP
jgi:uncharacterized protein YcaQ